MNIDKEILSHQEDKMYAPHNTKTMDATHETIIAKLGSKISMNFRPQTRQIFLSPIGRFFDKPVELNFGVMIDGIEYGLGFGYRQKDFQYIEQHEYFDRVVYRCKDFDLGLDCTFQFVSPFYPQNDKLCQLPALYVEASVTRFIDRKVRDDDERNIIVFCDARMTDFQDVGDMLMMESKYYLTDDHIHYQDTVYLKGFLNENPYHKKGIVGQLAIKCLNKNVIDGKVICTEGKISQKDTFRATFVIGGYCNEDILSVGSEKYKFMYTRDYASINDVMAYAASNYSSIMSKTQSFLDVLENSTISSNLGSLLGQSMRSFAANCWWCVNECGEEWFSVAEGNCLFHSTVDVEYNDGLFYYMLWPRLLEINFANWAKYRSKSHINHDVGAILNAGYQAYPHPMEVEENANFILMLYAYYKMYGNTEVVEKYIGLVEELVRFFKSCDTTGNGLPNLGTANTIDDSSDDVQFAEEQIYIGIKECAAYVAAKRMFKSLGKTEAEELCDAESRKIVNTIEKQGWRDDHYAVTLISSAGSINQYSLYQSVGGNVSEKGKDAYTIYTANGLLYLWMVGDDVDFSLDRLRSDIVNAHKECSTPYGDTHSSVDKSNVWISQNIWRDLCAAYLGVDMIDNVEKYWEYEVYENQGGRGGCFIDTYGWNKLNYYPRGLVSIGYLSAAIGLQIDAISKTISVRPTRVPVKMPVLQFANWEKGIVPTIEFFVKDGIIENKIEHGELIDMKILTR